MIKQPSREENHPPPTPSHPGRGVKNLDHLWLPYSQMKLAPLPPTAVSTQGCTITLKDGRTLIDGIASWWSMCHGYNHPHILAAVEKQLNIMPHVMFGGLVHEGAITLSERLSTLTHLPRVFFSDSGSVSVEVALKMALQYWRLKHKPNKDRFICFHNGYHGDTLGAMSVSDPEHSLHKAFRNSVIKQYVIDIPTDEYGFAEFDSLLASVHGNVAGLIIEPLVQGAGGMKFHSADVLAEIYRITKKHGILFIADEIATGFYRTGNLFACNEAGITPDIMCLGKALTAGTMTMGATLASAEIFDAFNTDSWDDAFMHGPTFMANPLACAAANASLDLFESPVSSLQSSAHPLPTGDWRLATDNWQRHIETIENQLINELAACEGLRGVVDVRVKGAIGVVQVDVTKVDAYALRKHFVDAGAWIRPFKDVIYLMPPLVITSEELRCLTEAIRKSLVDSYQSLV